MTFTVANTGAEALPASFGAHPGFNWPLRPDTPPEVMVWTAPAPACGSIESCAKMVVVERLSEGAPSTGKSINAQ
jgi:hypothetical protein